MKKNKRKNVYIAISAWLVLALAITIFFLVNKKKITENFNEADVSHRLFGNKSSQTETGDFSKNISKQNPVEIFVEGETDVADTTEITENFSDTSSRQTLQDKATALNENEKSNEKISSNADDSKVLSGANKNTTKVDLCFVIIGSDGSVSRKIVSRDLPQTSAPLTASLKALLAGPSASENCTTLIPSETKLKSATVRDGVAYLNFSDDFEINPVGAEGYTAQMMQIVYTATNFSTVNSVQFLIDGEKKEYLGNEGLWIGSPLNRASFR